MQWDDLLKRLRQIGCNTVEEDYVDEYGQFITGDYDSLKGRHLRCTYGRILVDGSRMDVYMFSSEYEATEFIGLVKTESIPKVERWTQRRNIVFHVAGRNPHLTEEIIPLL